MTLPAPSPDHAGFESTFKETGESHDRKAQRRVDKRRHVPLLFPAMAVHAEALDKEGLSTKERRARARGSKRGGFREKDENTEGEKRLRLFLVGEHVSLSLSLLLWLAAVVANGSHL